MVDIDQEAVAKKYNSIDTVWAPDDKWHLVTHNVIRDFIWETVKRNKQWDEFKILNAGSSGYSYGLNEDNIIHIDIAGDKISSFKTSIVASIESIPMPANSINAIICVGSVLNYCDPVKVFGEFAKVLTPNGFIIIEFENSHTFELVGKPSFNKKAALVETFYKGGMEKIWFFSESYIKELSKIYGFEILSIKRCHIISPLAYRLCRNENSAAKYSKLDPLLAFIPFIRKFSSNTILLLKKSNAAN